MKQKTQVLGDFYKGEGLSKYDRTAFDSLQNVDIHSEIGSCTCNYVLAKDTSSNVPDEPTILVTVNDGTVYALSTSSGKIWKRTTAGVWSLAATNTNGAHSGGAYFNNYLYYSTNAKLGRFDLASTWVDSWQEYTNDSTYKPMVVSMLSLMIGDGKYLASVDNAGTFSANALDIDATASATTLGDVENDTIIGSIGSTAFHDCKMYRWDNYASSWWDEKRFKEKGIGSIIEGEEYVFVSYGTAGKIGYLVQGARTQRIKRLRGVSSLLSHYKATCYEGKALLAVGNYIYSIHRSENGLPIAVCKEYTCSQATGSFNSVCVTGSQIIVSWTAGSTHGIDILSTNRATATIQTPVMLGKHKRVKVYYDSLPTGSTITIASNNDNAGSYTTLTTTTDSTDENCVYTESDIGNKRQAQFQIILTPSGANAPVINSIEVI